MKYAVLGSTGVRVSRICVGTMTFGNPQDESQCKNLVGYALDHGINYFDTADIYQGYDRTWGSSGGVGEEMLGQALVGRRHEAVVMTKYCNAVGTGPLDAGLSARHLDDQLNKTLKRLRTDYIDIVLAHRWDPSLPVKEVWRTFDRWVRAGKVLNVGISDWPCWRVAQACEIADRYGWAPVSVNSPKYSLLNRGMEVEHVPCALEYGIAMVTYQAFEGGTLTGKYRRGQAPPAGSRAAEKPGWVGKIEESTFDKLEALEKLAQEAGMSLSEYVTAWTLSRPGVTSVILGLRDAEQTNSAVTATEKCIPGEHQEKIDALFPRPKPLPWEQVLVWGAKGWALENLE